MLPFSLKSLFSLFGYYNRTIWPAPFVAFLLGAVVVALILRPIAGSSRMAAVVIALGWFWVGAVFHWRHFATLNFAAPVYAVLFVVQGMLVAWFGLIRFRLSFAGHRDAVWWAGIVMMIAALAGYPLADACWGPGWPSVRIFGLTPVPTILFTFGWFLASGSRRPGMLLVIPIVASVVEAYAAYVLRIPYDLIVPLAAIVTWVLVARRRTS